MDECDPDDKAQDCNHMGCDTSLSGEVSAGKPGCVSKAGERADECDAAIASKDCVHKECLGPDRFFNCVNMSGEAADQCNDFEITMRCHHNGCGGRKDFRDSGIPFDLDTEIRYCGRTGRACCFAHAGPGVDFCISIEDCHDGLPD